MRLSLLAWSPLIACAFLLACSGAKNETKPTPPPMVECAGPAWTCTGSGKCTIPELSESVCALGQADNIASEALGLQTAKTRARTEMARLLKTQVDGFTRAVQDSMSKQGVGEDSIQKIGDLAQDRTEAVLNGVSIPKTYVAPGNKYYALAAIDTKSLTTALKGLKDAAAMNEEVKKEIDRRADGIVDEWERERERQNSAASR